MRGCVVVVVLIASGGGDIELGQECHSSSYAYLTTKPYLTIFFSQQLSSRHVAAFKVPKLHELGPDTMYPSSHVG